jgi:hypothetical protein
LPVSETLLPTGRSEARRRQGLVDRGRRLANSCRRNFLKVRFPKDGPSGDHLGQIVLPPLSPGQIDRGKDIFQPGLSGIKTHGEKVLLGVIVYCHNPPKGDDGGAHGVRAAASHKPALLHHARHPEIYALDVHGKSSIWAFHPAFRLHPARPVLFMRQFFSFY